MEREGKPVDRYSGGKEQTHAEMQREKKKGETLRRMQGEKC